ncbi:hypothetical protein BJX63DRAFT_48409 [Aspergillus granulosus]|uniref:Uncharacterized protein n=1 Tax=Aspergillus granulosus TaxID=176169 RepID=A0ABR4HU79_9EURO
MIPFQTLCHFPSIISLCGHQPKFVRISVQTLSCVHHQALNLSHWKYLYQNRIHIKRLLSMAQHFPMNSAPHFSDPDPIPSYDIQDDADIPTEPPAFQGDLAEYSLSSPSISSSDDNLEEFFRLLDTQDDIPIDLVILANHKPRKDGNLQQSVPQAHSLINSEMTCSLKRLAVRTAILKQVTSHIHDHQQLHPSQHNTDPDASYPDGVRGDHHVSRQSQSSKRKAQQSDGRAQKRL